MTHPFSNFIIQKVFRLPKNRDKLSGEEKQYPELWKNNYKIVYDIQPFDPSTNSGLRAIGFEMQPYDMAKIHLLYSY